jgi:glutamyl-tRNA synthetase
MPQYAHLPLLLKPDGNGKLSKRDGDRLGFPVFPLDWVDPTSKEESSGYRERGYYPQAFVNMLAFLGWNPGTEQEIFSLEELAQAFSFDHIHKAGAKFDPEKAKWFNEQYLRHREENVIAQSIRRSVQEHFKLTAEDHRLGDVYLQKAVSLLKPRVQFEFEMLHTGSYLFHAPHSFDQAVIAKKWKPELEKFFLELKNVFHSLQDFSIAEIDSAFKNTAAAHEIKPGDVLQLFRVMISGQGGGVDLMGMIELLGKAEVSARIDNALEHIKR